VELLLHLQSLQDGRPGTPTSRHNDIRKRKEEQLLRWVQHFDIDFACGQQQTLQYTLLLNGCISKDIGEGRGLPSHADIKTTIAK
jgi:hypothetical protein